MPQPAQTPFDAELPKYQLSGPANPSDDLLTVETTVSKDNSLTSRLKRSCENPSNELRETHGSVCKEMADPRLDRVLVLHCGGTFGMTLSTSESSPDIKQLRAGGTPPDIEQSFPELRQIASVTTVNMMNIDSSDVGPDQWVQIAAFLHRSRDVYNGFVVIHGTDTMSYTASALSLMLAGFRKPIVVTGSQLPMSAPRSDARQNLIDSVSVVTSGKLQEVGICFGGTLLRANQAVKFASSAYRAFTSPNYPVLAVLGTEVEWNYDALLRDVGPYRPRFKLERSVVRVPVVPGLNPSVGYGNLTKRGVKGAVIESFGVGNLPEQSSLGWGDWFQQQRDEGLEIYIGSQCASGPLNPELYMSGKTAIELGARATRQMTAETAVIKMMLCLAYEDLNLNIALAGEL